MQFSVLASGVMPPRGANSEAFLVEDNWDDWFQYNTQYRLFYADWTGTVHDIGLVKIGEFGMRPLQRRAAIPNQFQRLGDEFFSLGQDETYYQQLTHLPFSPIKRGMLESLNDLALDEQRFGRARHEEVTRQSLLRHVSPKTVKGQFRRIALGGARLSQYAFEYTTPSGNGSFSTPTSLSFDVVPDSQPPTNVHVLIGRNGVGKTTLLHHMSLALADPDSPAEDVGTFRATDGDSQPFANLVSVTFSAFDPFKPLPTQGDPWTGLTYSYVGLKRTEGGAPKAPGELTREFVDSVSVCLQGARLDRWRRALRMLEADPIFSDARVADLANAADDISILDEEARALFERFSSGHKIVLLTITRLVECVEERSLVLLDEPEAHLHPPLLAAFVRALSDLLINRNGVAIVATHSPVVLQEVPKSCAWKLRRSGYELVAERPEIETFGENVGVLTREVFGLEVTQSGFHRLLEQAIQGRSDYEAVLSYFEHELGGEAKGIVRALLAAREVGG